MIYVLLTGQHDYTIGKFLETHGAPLRGALEALRYEDIFRRRTLPAGTYILSDFERLTPRRRSHASLIADALESSDVARLLNHPSRCLGRFDLLRALHLRGTNPFAAYPLAQLPPELVYPVFLRLADDHQGARTALLTSRAEVDAAAATLARRGKSTEQILVVEFCETVDPEGWYRKYGAFSVGGRIVPRHLFFGRPWNLKAPSNTEDWQFDEEEVYMRDNPHEAALQQIFQEAGIGYGRIDYALINGRICVWEINTNPMIAIPEDFTTGRPGELHALFHQGFREALHAIDTDATGEIPLPRFHVGLGERLSESRERLRRRYAPSSRSTT